MVNDHHVMHHSQVFSQYQNIQIRGFKASMFDAFKGGKETTLTPSTTDVDFLYSAWHDVATTKQYSLLD